MAYIGAIGLPVCYCLAAMLRLWTFADVHQYLSALCLIAALSYQMLKDIQATAIVVRSTAALVVYALTSLCSFISEANTSPF